MDGHVALEDMPLSTITDRLLEDLLRRANEQPDQVAPIADSVQKLADRLFQENATLYRMYGALHCNGPEDMDRFDEFTKVMDRVDVAFEVLQDSQELNLTTMQRLQGTVRLLQPVVGALNYVQQSYAEFGDRIGDQLTVELYKLQGLVQILNQRNYEVQEYFMLTFLHN